LICSLLQIECCEVSSLLMRQTIIHSQSPGLDKAGLTVC
jgi:hypothetical protein